MRTLALRGLLAAILLAPAAAFAHGPRVDISVGIGLPLYAPRPVYYGHRYCPPPPPRRVVYYPPPRRYVERVEYVYPPYPPPPRHCWWRDPYTRVCE